MLGDKDIYRGQGIPTNLSGPFAPQTYTFVIESSIWAGEEPSGDGYGLVSLRTNGQIVVSGGLGDGHKLKPVVTTVSKNGDWPLYALMYKSAYSYVNPKGQTVNTTIDNGSIIGWLKFTNSTGEVTNRELLDGSVIWVKKGWTNAVYPAGFTNQFTVLGSGYFEPPPNTRVIPWTTFSVEVENGNLDLYEGQFFTNYAVLNDANTFTFLVPNVNTQKMQILRKTGQLKGSFWHPNMPGATKPITFYGAVLQDEMVARGYFVGTNQTGSVRVRPY